MQFNKDTNILIVGLGVIGGGYAAKLSSLGYKVRCITKEQADIDYALENKMILEGKTDVDKDLIYNSDLIIFALYPTIFIDWIKENQHLFRRGTLITDVTGVKKSVVEVVQSMLRDDVEFIPHHPMAGRERSGVQYADCRVFEGANFIVTPTEKNSKEAIELVKELGKELGFAKISQLTVDEHDRMIAFLSQLTHCIAVTLMTCSNEPNLEKYTGDSFRDLTRIAKINDRMWSELFAMNKDALLMQMDAFSREFETFRQYVASGDVESMREKMRYATLRRTDFDKPVVEK